MDTEAIFSTGIEMWFLNYILFRYANAVPLLTAFRIIHKTQLASALRCRGTYNKRLKPYLPKTLLPGPNNEAIDIILLVGPPSVITYSSPSRAVA